MSSNKPVWSMKSGNIEASAWVQSSRTRDGRDFQTVNVKLDRRYRTTDGEWKSSQFFGVNDLQKLHFLCIKAINRAMEEETRLQRGEAA